MITDDSYFGANSSQFPGTSSRNVAPLMNYSHVDSEVDPHEEEEIKQQVAMTSRKGSQMSVNYSYMKSDHSSRQLTTFQQQQSIQNCVNCMSGFNMGSHQPHTLECGHQVCKECFEGHNNDQDDFNCPKKDCQLQKEDSVHRMKSAAILKMQSNLLSSDYYNQQRQSSARAQELNFQRQGTSRAQSQGSYNNSSSKHLSQPLSQQKELFDNSHGDLMMPDIGSQENLSEGGEDEKDEEYFNSDIHNLVSADPHSELTRTKQKPPKTNMDMIRLQKLTKEKELAKQKEQHNRKLQQNKFGGSSDNVVSKVMLDPNDQVEIYQRASSHDTNEVKAPVQWPIDQEYSSSSKNQNLRKKSHMLGNSGGSVLMQKQQDDYNSYRNNQKSHQDQNSKGLRPNSSSTNQYLNNDNNDSPNNYSNYNVSQIGASNIEQEKGEANNGQNRRDSQLEDLEMENNQQQQQKRQSMLYKIEIHNENENAQQNEIQRKTSQQKAMDDLLERINKQKNTDKKQNKNKKEQLGVDDKNNVVPIQKQLVTQLSKQSSSNSIQGANKSSHDVSNSSKQDIQSVMKQKYQPQGEIIEEQAMEETRLMNSMINDSITKNQDDEDSNRGGGGGIRLNALNADQSEIIDQDDEDMSMDVSIADYSIIGGKKKKKKKKKKKGKKGINADDVSMLSSEGNQVVKSKEKPEQEKDLNTVDEVEDDQLDASPVGHTYSNQQSQNPSNLWDSNQIIHHKEQVQQIKQPLVINNNIVEQYKNPADKKQKMSELARAGQQIMSSSSGSNIKVKVQSSPSQAPYSSSKKGIDSPSYASDNDNMKKKRNGSVSQSELSLPESVSMQQQLLAAQSVKSPYDMNAQNSHHTRELKLISKHHQQLEGSSMNLLQVMCDLHPDERIKYFCRDDQVGLCPECVVFHAKHDFILADEGAAFEVKQQLSGLSMNVQSRTDEYELLLKETDQKLKELERFKDEEFKKLKFYFVDIHRCLDAREEQIKRQYMELTKDAQEYLSTDSQKLSHILAQLDQVKGQITALNKGFERSTEQAIVGSSDRIKNIQKTYLNFSTRLYNKNPPKSFTIRSKDIPSVPIFQINLSHCKRFIENLGSLQAAPQFRELKYITENMNTQQQEFDPLTNEYLFRETLQNNELKNSMIFNLDPMSPNKKQMSPQYPLSQPKNMKVNQMMHLSKNQKLQLMYQQMPSTENVYWPKWDSFEVLKFDFFRNQWNTIQQSNQQQDNQRPSSKFLFFSSIAHLPKGLGMFILGGSDSDDNFSKRTILFNKYLKFAEKPPMIFKRAFFPSIFCLSDSCLYAFGGHDGEQDLGACERYSVAENVWRSIMPMNIKKNGASVIAFEKVIFLFGGNNQEQGSLDIIERYAIEYDKWTLIKLKLVEPVHDTVAFNIGGMRALIFGGSANGSPNTKFNIYDMTCECLSLDEITFEGGKIYLPPAMDLETSVLHIYQGYGDSVPVHEKLKLASLICRCRSHDIKDGIVVKQSKQIDQQEKPQKLRQNQQLSNFINNSETLSQYNINQLPGKTQQLSKSQIIQQQQNLQHNNQDHIIVQGFPHVDKLKKGKSP